MKYQLQVFAFNAGDERVIPSGWEVVNMELDEGILYAYCKHAFIHEADKLNPKVAVV